MVLSDTCRPVGWDQGTMQFTKGIAEHVIDSGMAWVSDEVAAAFAAGKYGKREAN